MIKQLANIDTADRVITPRGVADVVAVRFGAPGQGHRRKGSLPPIFIDAQLRNGLVVSLMFPNDPQLNIEVLDRPQIEMFAQ